MTTQSSAYVAGRDACMRGEDGRYTNPFLRGSTAAYAWDAGFLDAMEAEGDETPDPPSAGFA